MDKNLGKKVAGLGKAIFVLGCFLSVVGGIVCIIIAADSYYLEWLYGVGVAVIVVGCVFSWLITLFIRCIGQLVQTNTEMLEYAKADNANLVKLASIITSGGTNGMGNNTGYQTAYNQGNPTGYNPGGNTFNNIP